MTLESVAAAKLRLVVWCKGCGHRSEPDPAEQAREGVRSVWLSDHTRPFVIVLVEAAGQQDHPLGPFGHLGVACASREEIDRLYAEACREGRPTRAPIDAGDPVGYTVRIADPDGHSLELSFGQEVGLTVQSAAKG
jgi:lactoylglutathione lyase